MELSKGAVVFHVGDACCHGGEGCLLPQMWGLESYRGCVMQILLFGFLLFELLVITVVLLWFLSQRGCVLHFEFITARRDLLS